jgi:hypothetical protein
MTVFEGWNGYGAEGELDAVMPGWADDNKRKHDDDHRAGASSKRKSMSHSTDGPVRAIHEVGNLRRSASTGGEHTIDVDRKIGTTPSEDDGTDDYLHHPSLAPRCPNFPKQVKGPSMKVPRARASLWHTPTYNHCKRAPRLLAKLSS